VFVDAVHSALPLQDALRPAVPAVVVAFVADAFPAGHSVQAVKVAVLRARLDVSVALVQVAVLVSPLVLRAQKSWEPLASAQQQVQTEPPRVARQVSQQQASPTVLRAPHSVQEPLAQLVSAQRVPQPEPSLLERPVLQLELVVSAVLQVQPLARAQQRVPLQLESVLEQASAKTGAQLLLPRRVRHARRWPRLLPQLQHPQRPSGDAGLFPLHQQESSSNAFSFRLRHNPAAGQ
jgi:hypothetical protein